jgi:hypothetical protein
MSHVPRQRRTLDALVHCSAAEPPHAATGHTAKRASFPEELLSITSRPRRHRCRERRSHFHRSPDQFGLDQVRDYQPHLAIVSPDTRLKNPAAPCAVPHAPVREL